MTRIRRYFDEVWSELRKVSWPTREHVRNLTVLVFAISLAVGTNIVSTVVTAQDGITTKTYTLTISRAAAPNADLVSLVPSTGTLSPGFASGTTSYSASVPNTTTVAA